MEEREVGDKILLNLMRVIFMADQISKDFTGNPYQILESMASQFSLHMEF